MNKDYKVAILNYGLGNIFSLKHACINIGVNPIITNKTKDILSSDALILPGVGAFGDAMKQINKLKLRKTLIEFYKSQKPFIGICLGMQLLLSKSEEFGVHEGLNLVTGVVKKLKFKNKNVKIPHVGWNNINMTTKSDVYKTIKNNERMYFVHSYISILKNKEITLTKTKYGNIEFCSSFKYKNLYGFQFHPERSAIQGLKIYKNIFLKDYNTGLRIK